MTQKQAFQVSVETLNTLETLTAEQQEALAILTDLANRDPRKTKSGKPTKKQLENAEYAKVIQAYLNKDTFLCYNDFVSEHGNEISQQKFTAVLKPLIEDKLVEKGQTDDKRVGYRLV